MSRRKIRTRKAKKKERPVGVSEALQRDLHGKRMEKRMLIHHNLMAMLNRGVLELDRIEELKYTRDIAEWLGHPIAAVQRELRRIYGQNMRKL